jgi:low molecular weight phosphotyrosine protein phosphatase
MASTRSKTASTSASEAQPAINGAHKDAKPVSVLFVCLGNICRSPMAEGMFRHLTRFNTPEQHPLISRIDSCGTGAYHCGDQPDSRTLAALSTRGGITDYKHKARKIRVPADFEEFDYILAMDEDNRIDIRDMVKRARKKGVLGEEMKAQVLLYGEFGGKAKDEEIGDPYYGGKSGFEIAYEQVERFGKGLLRHIEENAAEGEGTRR